MDTYNRTITYPKEAFIYLMIGIGLTFAAYLIIQSGRKQEAQIKNNNESGKDKDNRIFINKMWDQREKIGDRLVVFLFIMLAVLSIFDFGRALSLIQPLILTGMIGYSFLHIMRSEDEDMKETNLQPRKRAIRYFLRLIDYREHPFSIPLLLFIIIVMTFLLSKHFGLMLSLETSGNPRYVMSLPTSAWITAGLVFACAFMYIIQHCNFFGIHQAEQGEYKVIQIHFAEIIVCGATFFIWLVVLSIALFTG
ncbi:hypothetical protein [Paenibacillus lutrae]|uniref:Uncharacterized protein n=1 Tax=Paenibacillus lutrae TaxID=2078573 RepID=A0A7X3FJ77_9BACL|nr:hypothetical protein [Paenibacillus lutrae]MVP00660.1 hypothetical protein [Paenibacillus lutrae]